VSTNPITPLTPEQTATQELQALHEDYLRRLIVQVDDLLNVASGGQPDMTISSRAALAAKHGSKVGIELSKLLNDFQADHGAKADAGDLARANAVALDELNSGEVTALPQEAPLP
jgi:hypothetical protein